VSSGRLAASLALAAIALGATACSSSSSPGTTTTTSGSGATTTTAAGGNSTTTSTSASGGASLSQIETKLKDGQTATFLATYKLTSKSTSNSSNGTLTIAHDGSDSLFGVTEASGTFEEIATGSKSVICSKSSGAWQCFSGALGASISGSLTGIENLYGSKAAVAALKADSSVSGVKESTSSVGGTPVTCFTYHATTTTTTGSWTYCVTDSGVLAEANTQNTAGSSSLVLTSLTSNVSASEFTPPATPTSTPG
jgi:hypothetical protein